MVHETTQPRYDCAVVKRHLILFVAVVGLIASCGGLPGQRGHSYEGGRAGSAAAAGDGSRGGEERVTSLIARAIDSSPSSTTVVVDGTAPVALVYDLDGNGGSDVALRGVKGVAESRETTGETPLYRPTTPPVPESESLPFVLEYYLDGSGSSSTATSGTVSLGSFPAARSFETIPLGRDGGLPVAISSQFYSPRGSNSVWVVFQDGLSRSVLSLKENPNAGFEIVDIDGDGILDLVTSESRLEEGRGYETYLTLYRLEADGYVPRATTNVVRNLNSFLDEIRMDILRGRWDSIASRSSRDLLGSGIERMNLVFQATDDPSLTDVVRPFGDFASLGIQDVVFPQLFESPFESLAERESVRLPVNIVDAEGAMLPYLLSVRYRSNPFEGEQFELVPQMQ